MDLPEINKSANTKILKSELFFSFQQHIHEDTKFVKAILPSNKVHIYYRGFWLQERKQDLRRNFQLFKVTKWNIYYCLIIATILMTMNYLSSVASLVFRGGGEESGLHQKGRGC